MTSGRLTRERILDAACDVLRRFGPAKATVVDVARALGVSHGAVYRHFPSKAALREAVVERWLLQVKEPLARITVERSGAPRRLRRWVEALVAFKRRSARVDPALFAGYARLAGESRGVIGAHVGALLAQLTRIIADGVARGELRTADAAAAARAVFDATGRFHNPAHAREWARPGIERELRAVLELCLAGLGAGGPGQRPTRRSRPR